MTTRSRLQYGKCVPAMDPPSSTHKQDAGQEGIQHASEPYVKLFAGPQFIRLLHPREGPKSRDEPIMLQL